MWEILLRCLILMCFVGKVWSAYERILVEISIRFTILMDLDIKCRSEC